jgi:hypothetical protein
VADQASEIIGKWEDGIIGSSVTPVRKDRALTPPSLWRIEILFI